MIFETFDNIFQNGVEGIDTDFTVGCLRRNTGVLEEGKEVAPCTLGHLDTSDGSDHPCSRVTDKFSMELWIRIRIDQSLLQDKGSVRGFVEDDLGKLGLDLISLILRNLDPKFTSVIAYTFSEFDSSKLSNL